MKKMRTFYALVATAAFSLGSLAALGADTVSSASGVITASVAADLKFVPLDPADSSGKGVKISILFGDLKSKGPIGFVSILPAGFHAGRHMHSSDLYLVSIKGLYHQFVPGGSEGKPLGAGGHVFVSGNTWHDNHCDEAGGPCWNYNYYPNGFDKKTM